MDEVLTETVVAARNVYNEYIKIGLSSELSFKGVGTQYILFAIKEPKLFQVLFMRDLGEKADALNTLPVIDDNYSEILLSVQKQYSFSKAESKRLYEHLWIYTHGIASLIATGVCRFTAEKISSMMTDVCKSLVSQTRVEQNMV